VVRSGRDDTNEETATVDPWSLLGHVDTAIGVVAPDGTILRVTDAIEDITGRPSAYYAGRHVAGELHPDDVQAIRDQVARLTAGTDGDREHSRVRISTAEGDWRWIDQVITRALQVDGLGAFVSSMRDVDTEHRAVQALRRREAALQELLRRRPVGAEAASERRFRALAQHGSDAFFTFDDDLRVTSMSDAAEAVLGCSPERAMATPAFTNVLAGDRHLVAAALDRLRQAPGGTERLRLRVRDGTGDQRWNDACITNLLDHPDVGEWVCNFWDVTAVVRAEEENRRLLEIFDLTDDSVLLLDADGNLMYLNAAGCRFFGIDQVRLARLIGRPWPLQPDRNSAMTAALDTDRFESWSGEVTAQGASGPTPASLQVLAHRDADDRIDYYSAVLRDITDRKQLEATLERQATHDPLTGLPNRALLFQRIAGAVEGLRAAGSSHQVGLLFIDLDHFKAINDSLGHALGDRLLRSIGERIRTAVRPGDTVARFGGDEFVVLCQRLEDPQDAVVIAHRVESTLQAPFQVDGHEIRARVSIGIAFADPSDADPVAVLRDADTAMYQAKSDGRGRWVMFDEGLREQAVERERLETALRLTRHGEDLVVHYQPVVDLGTGRVVSAEALVRWQRDDRTTPPDEFIPVAEESGLIVPIGAWVLRTACEQMAGWQAAGVGDIGLAVNVSARQLLHPGFVAGVAEVLRETGLRPSTLCLELTETVLLDDVDVSRDRLAQLRDLGLRIAVDDFGTGYSSLTYLHRLPLDVVKLDRSFVEGVGTDPGDTAIVTAVVDLARTMGLDAVAEGIESELQLAHLRGIGCRFGQGYLLARPMPAEEFGRLLAGDPVLDGNEPFRTADPDDPGSDRDRNGHAGTSPPAGSPPG
jgi:diguanylate cyclase (GGDEF)-like protein/PAS domain S-box-containing protein